MDLSTRYMGLVLDNPIIASSSPFTASLDGVRRCADAGAGAVVLKSIFEEQIEAGVDQLVEQSEPLYWHAEARDYIEQYGRANEAQEYLKLIGEAKKAVSVPVIASLHCVSAGAWTKFAKQVEDAGADALELNVFLIPADPRRDGREQEKIHFDVAREVKKTVSIPLSLKVGSFFSGLMRTMMELSVLVDGLVLFNRFLQMDIDIEKLELISSDSWSTPADIATPLQWISILAHRVDCDLAATTGIHDGKAVVKQLLAGAAAVQVCSALQANGFGVLGDMLDELRGWMKRHGYSSLQDFRGKMSRERSENPGAYERVQFMKRSVSAKPRS
jgi:dihydroorotate dehydrogenase (fumarate)